MMPKKDKQRLLDQYYELRVSNHLCGLGDKEMPRFYTPLYNISPKKIKKGDLELRFNEEADIRRLFLVYLNFDRSATTLEKDQLYSSNACRQRRILEKKLARLNAQSDNEQKQ